MRTTLAAIVFILGVASAAQAQYAPTRQQLAEQIDQQNFQMRILQRQMEDQRRQSIAATMPQPQAEPLVTYIDGVPQPPVLSNNIRTGTRKANQAKMEAYEAALAIYQARLAREQQQAQQLATLQQQVEKLTAELQKINERAGK